MAQITASAVAELRAKTGCGMMDCKKALTATEGNFDEAVKYLRERGLAVAAKKADRIAAEGVVDILCSADGKSAAMIEVNAETDFVAKNDSFREFVTGILRTILANRPASLEELSASKFDGGEFTVEQTLKDKIFTIGENISIRRFVIVDGILNTYIHGKGVTGVIVTFDASDNLVGTEGFAEISKNVALQVAAMNCQYALREDVPESVINEEKEILITQIKNDPKNASKPQAIIEKMVSGRIGKFYETNCLVDQAYVKDDAMSVAAYVKTASAALGGSASVKAFYRYEKGEGLKKREEDFAAEIAKLVK